MSTNDNEDARNQEFLSLADQFIDLANNQLSGHDPSMIRASFMFAASRFTAFTVAASLDDAKAFEKEKAESLKHFSDEFQSMLEQNLDQHDELLGDVES